MSTREFSPGERHDHPSGYEYNGWGVSGRRKWGEMTATLTASCRTNADERDSVAATMATLTESWTIETVTPRREWLITYRTTHRIIPIKEVI